MVVILIITFRMDVVRTVTDRPWNWVAILIFVFVFARHFQGLPVPCDVSLSQLVVVV